MACVHQSTCALCGPLVASPFLFIASSVSPSLWLTGVQGLPHFLHVLAPQSQHAYGRSSLCRDAADSRWPQRWHLRRRSRRSMMTLLHLRWRCRVRHPCWQSPPAMHTKARYCAGGTKVREKAGRGKETEDGKKNEKRKQERQKIQKRKEGRKKEKQTSCHPQTNTQTHNPNKLNTKTHAKQIASVEEHIQASSAPWNLQKTLSQCLHSMRAEEPCKRHTRVQFGHLQQQQQQQTWFLSSSYAHTHTHPPSSVHAHMHNAGNLTCESVLQEAGSVEH